MKSIELIPHNVVVFDKAQNYYHYILMIHRQGFVNGDASDIRNSFQKIADEAIIEQV